MLYWIAIAGAAGLAGVVFGWVVTTARARATRRAVEADWAERVGVAERGRDRHRALAGEAQSRFERLRDEHLRCESRIQRLERGVRSARKAHRGCDARIEELEAAAALLQEQLSGACEDRERALTRVEREGAESRQRLEQLRRELRGTDAATARLRAERDAAEELHAGCDERIRELEQRVAALTEMRDRRFYEAKRLRYRRRTRLVH